MIRPDSIAFKIPSWGLRSLGVNPSKYYFFRQAKSHLTKLWYSFNPSHVRVYRKYIKRGSIVIDIGACHGDYIKRALRRGAGRVIAFEPSPRLYLELNHRFLNNLKVLIWCSALGNKTGNVSFYDTEKETGGASCLKEVSPRDGKLIKVFMNKLDNIIDHRVDFIKIDAQGMDFDILKGAQMTLRKYKPVVLAEYFKPGLEANGQTLLEMLTYMDRLGYNFQTIQSNNEVTDILFIPN